MFLNFFPCVYMLGANLGLLLYGDVSVMCSFQCNDSAVVDSNRL